MEMKTMIRSCIIIKDPDFQKDVNTLRDTHNIVPKPFPNDITYDTEQESLIFADCLLDLVGQETLSNERFKSLEDNLDFFKSCYVSGQTTELFELLWKNIPSFWYNLYQLTIKWFPRYPLSIMGNYGDPIQRFFIRSIFFDVKELPETHYERVWLHELSDFYGVEILIYLLYAEKLLSKHLNIGLVSYMQKNDPMLLDFLNEFREHANNHPKLFIELYPGITKSDILDNWKDVDRHMKSIYWRNKYEDISKLPVMWREYVEQFLDYQFNGMSYNKIAEKYSYDKKTIETRIKQTANLADYELRSAKTENAQKRSR